MTPRHKEVVTLVERVVKLVVDIRLEGSVEHRIEIHGREWIDAMERAVVAREQHANKPMDAHRVAERQLQSKEQKGRSDVFNDEV